VPQNAATNAVRKSNSVDACMEPLVPVSASSAEFGFVANVQVAHASVCAVGDAGSSDRC